jgi:peptidoglycan/LPS O-acetylase OafA/YrhL
MVALPNPKLGVPEWASVVRFGRMGVTLFFVVSAFSLCYSTSLHRDHSDFAFYTRRFFRIAPLFYAMLIFYFWRDFRVFHLVHHGPEVLENFTFTFNFVPMRQGGYVLASWTIGVEVLFYVLFPFLNRYAAHDIWKGLSLFLASILLAALAHSALQWFDGDPGDYYQWTFLRHLPIFTLGILAYQVMRRAPDDYRRSSIGLALIGAAAVLLDAVVNGKTPLIDSYDWEGVVFATLLCGLLANPVSILVNRVTVFLGKISYSMYLVHPVLVLVAVPLYARIYQLPVSLSTKFIACALLTLLPLVAISYCTFLLIESPGMRLGKWLLESRTRYRTSQVRPSLSVG